MEFCPECGTRLVSKRKRRGSKVTLLLLCTKCGYKRPVGHIMEPVIKAIDHTTQEPIVVIGKEEQRLRTLPTLKIECPKCRNNVAYAWQVQTRGSDESSTQFFRCTKCNYTFREYS